MRTKKEIKAADLVINYYSALMKIELLILESKIRKGEELMIKKKDRKIVKIIFFGLGSIITEIILEELSTSEFTIFITDTEEETKELLKNEFPDIILSNFNASENNPVEFLNYIKEHYPTVNRYLFCDGSEKFYVKNLLNDNIITNYFINPDDLINLLDFLHCIPDSV